MRQDLARSARSKTVLLRTVQRKQGAAAASSLLKGMVEEDVEVNVFHYNTVISGWAAEGDLERAIETFAQMRERHVKASIVSYGALCGIEWRHGMQILQQLEAENLEPNAILLTSAAAALQQGQKWEVAVGALHSLMIRQVLTNVICQNSVANASAKAVQWWAALHQQSAMQQANIPLDSTSCVCSRSAWSSAYQMLKNATAASIRSNQIMVNSGAAACTDAHQWKQVICLLEWMASTFLEQSVVSFNTAVTAYGRRSWSRAAEVLQAAMEQLQPNVVTFNSSIDALDQTHWHFSVVMLDRMRSLQIQTDQLTRNCLISCGVWNLGLSCIKDVLGFNAAMSSCEQSGHWWHAMALFTSLCSSGSLRPSLVSQNAALSACKQGSQWQRAVQLLRRCRTARSLHDSFSYNSCISACGVAWAEALKCLSSMACCIRPDLVAYNAASHATGLAHAWEQSLQLFHEAARVEQRDSAAYGTVVMASGSGFCWPRSLAQLLEMIQVDFHPEVGILSSAISSCEKSLEQFRPQRTLFSWALVDS